MEASDIKLTVSAEDIYSLVREVKNLKAVNAELHKDIDTNHKAQDCLRAEFAAYKAAESEREANIRRQADKELENLVKDCLRRTKVLELNERKVNAHQRYHNIMGIHLDNILSILSKHITKSDHAKIEKEQKRILDEWKKFDAVQNEVANELAMANWDPCKTKMPPPSVKDAICEDCAAKMGKVPVDYPVGHWTGYCDFCGQAKSLSSLSRDYVDKKKGGEA